MTEKAYGGSQSFGAKNKEISKKSEKISLENTENKKKLSETEEDNLNNYGDYLKAGEITKKVKEFAKLLIKKDMLLIDIAEKIETKIIELGGKPAFPVNLSVNEIAAHDTPSFDDKRKAEGLLKVDFGVAVNGCLVDIAFSLDLENSDENKKLINASEEALKEALKIAADGLEIAKIGDAIHKKITSLGFSPIRNLSGHQISRYLVHAGVTIPNYNNNSTVQLKEGVYAIEPFSTVGQGIVYDGRTGEIYSFISRKGVRDLLARKIQDFIEQEYKTLPFCERWIIKKFGIRAKTALKLLEQACILHNYSLLIEKSQQKVSQAENTILIHNEKVEILG